MDFFISYNHADRPWALWIAWQLEDAGYRVTVQDWDFSPGTNFVMQMQQAATTAERTIAVLSPAYLTARYTQPEWMAAFHQDPTGEQGKLVPVRVRECAVDGLLSSIVYIDLVGLAESEAREVLLSKVKRGRAKPHTRPFFPTVGALSATKPLVKPPHYPELAAPVTFAVEHGDITKFQADTVVLKYAQEFYGADHRTMRRLTAAGIAEHALCPAVGEYRYVDTRGAIKSSHALFVGVKPLWDLRYRDMRRFAVLALKSLVKQAADVEHVAMTIHGPGFGLDEMECVLALTDGLLDCLARDTLPKSLRRISIVEIDGDRVARLRRLLQQKLGRATLSY